MGSFAKVAAACQAVEDALEALGESDAVLPLLSFRRRVPSFDNQLKRLRCAL
jgi:hypothetical protein